MSSSPNLSRKHPASGPASSYELSRKHPASGQATSYKLRTLCSQLLSSQPLTINHELLTTNNLPASFLLSQRLAPLFHHLLGLSASPCLPVPVSTLPPETAAACQRAYLTTAWQNAERLDELQRILALFAEHGIQVVLLKGVALVYTHYEKAALRPMLDTDLLLRPADLPAAAALLAADGYTRITNINHDTPFEVEIPLKHPNGQMVELHSALLMAPHNLSPAGMDWFFANRDPLPQAAPNAWVLNPTALLLHLCAHLWLHHAGGDLLDRFDIYLVLQHDAARIDWDDLLARAVEFDLLLPLQRTLPELASEWGAPVPPDVLEHLRRLQPSRRERRKFGLVLGEATNYPDTILNSILAYPDWPTRLRFARLLFFPAPAYMLQRYHRRSPLWLPWLYLHRLLSRAVQQLRRQAPS
jgi:hypothetical protein